MSTCFGGSLNLPTLQPYDISPSQVEAAAETGTSVDKTLAPAVSILAAEKLVRTFMVGEGKLLGIPFEFGACEIFAQL